MSKLIGIVDKGSEPGFGMLVWCVDMVAGGTYYFTAGGLSDALLGAPMAIGKTVLVSVGSP